MEDASDRVEAQLWPWVQDVLEAWDVPGLAIALVQNGVEITTRAFGTSDRRSNEPITADTSFHLASISKTFVASAVLQLLEEGRLDLETGVTAYLPDLPWGDARASSITLAHLLSHTSGLGDVTDYGWHEPELDDGALGRFAARVAGWSLEREPGTAFAYSNAAYELLGHLVATIGGQTFEGHLRERVLHRAGMTASSYLLDEVPPHLLAAPHLGQPPQVVPGIYPFTRRHAPSSTLHASATEMGRWMVAHLAAGDGLLSPETHELMWTPRTETGWDNPHEAMALGWFLGTHRGHRAVGHSGSDPGFLSNLVMLPDLGIGVTMLSNGNTAPLNSLTRAALDVLLGLEPAEPPILETDERGESGTWGLIEMHRTDLAWPLLREWMEAEPTSSQAWFMTGWAHEIDGHRGAAVEHLERAIELDPDNEEPEDMLRRLAPEGS